MSSPRSRLARRLVANDALETQNAPLVAMLKQQIEAMYSNAETTLAQFGLTPKKPRKPLTTEELAAKAAATWLARGTTSKKQKATDGVNIVPVTTGSSGEDVRRAVRRPPLLRHRRLLRLCSW
jgi:hypothetical protein